MMTAIADDPYPQPFNWHDSLTIEPTEPVDLRGLIPCEWQCEGGLLPLIDGTMIACPSCQEQQ